MIDALAYVGGLIVDGATDAAMLWHMLWPILAITPAANPFLFILRGGHR